MSRLALLPAWSCLILALSACAPAPPAATAPQPPGAVAVPAASVKRAVTLSPALTEIAFAIGAGDRVVGVSDFTEQPAAASGLPRLGGPINPNLELLTSLKPDLVVVQGQADQIRRYCTEQGIRYEAYKLDSVLDVLRCCRSMGAAMGVTAGAEAEVKRLQAGIVAVQSAVGQRAKPKTLLCVGRAPGPLAGLTTCGQGSFLDDLLTIAGSHNVFGDQKELYPQPSLEAITALAPDLIIDLQPGERLSAADKKAKAAEWNRLATVPAVRSGRVVVLDDDAVMIPGPRLTEAAWALARAVHPDLQAPAVPAAKP